MPETGARARFADFAFDPESGELRRGTQVTRLQRQPARVLEVLLRDSGAVVTREALKAAVWPNTVVEFDQGLNYCIRQIRSALDDTADAPRFIETLARRGYRFIEPVTWERATDAPPPKPISPESTPTNPESAPAAVRRTAPVLLAVVALVCVMVLALFRGGRDTSSPVAASANEPIASSLRVAVIPLREPLPDIPLTERLVVELAAAEPRLDVLGPATTGAMRGDERSQLAMGADLRVAYIISGGIRSADSGLFVQAARVADGTHVFARIISRDVIRDAAAQDSAMRKLADSLAVRLHDDMKFPVAPKPRSGRAPNDPS
jgi:DNA-binding winged helix-turn-helix (wHTH) protein/TolB-like protein